MRPLLAHSLLFAALLTAPACFDSDEFPPEDESSSGAEPGFRGAAMSPGTMWGPCSQADWGEWGCAGSLGNKLACLRPLFEIPLSICVPQTADPRVDADCGNMWNPGYANGVQLHPSEAYCVGLCRGDTECPQDFFCSSHGICAWHE